VVLTVEVLTLATAFVYVFPAAGLVAAVDFSLGFLDPAFFLVVARVPP
jgi:hypothetical protein